VSAIELAFAKFGSFSQYIWILPTCLKVETIDTMASTS